MKNTFANGFPLKLSFLSLVMAVLIALIPSSGTQAQSNSVQDFYFVPNGPYVAADIAMARVLNQIEILKPQFDFLGNHTQEYRNLAAKVDFYLAIYEHINLGNTVLSGIQQGLTVLTSDQHETLPKAMRQSYKDEAIQMLKL